MNIHVYRIEHPSNSIGPYQTDSHKEIASANPKEWNAWLGLLYGKHDAVNGRPTLGAENLAAVFDDQRCAFLNLVDLRWWFDGALDWLHILGFQIATYEVPGHLIARGRKQIVFDWSAAKLLTREPILESN